MIIIVVVISIVVVVVVVVVVNERTEPSVRVLQDIQAIPESE
jgi:hypothetical protein